jgi:purine-nucleoside phosphorylase
MNEIQTAAQFLNGRFGPAPKVAVVLGSGMSAFADTLTSHESISTQEIPGGMTSSIVGHAGKLVVGFAGATKAAVLAGRVHGYEGHSPAKVVFNLRALRVWGVKEFILTNAAGSTSKAYKPGSLVLLKDHINFTCQNPLVGKELFGGPRFPDMSDAYSKDWRKKVTAVAKKLKIQLKEGVYAGVLGPSFETPTEIKMFAKLGATMVGMSTVWECIALHQMGAKVLGISCITNFGTGVTSKPLSHDEVIEETKGVQAKFNQLMTAILEKTLS